MQDTTLYTSRPALSTTFIRRFDADLTLCVPEDLGTSGGRSPEHAWWSFVGGAVLSRRLSRSAPHTPISEARRADES